MAIYSGTSGFSYKEWKGVFYPEDLPAKDMLSFYGGRLPAVEINNTFYRLPKTALLENWANQVPADFRFSIKASRRITHIKRLKDAEEETSYLFETLKTLEDRLGVVLFQLPPYLRKGVERLRAFIELLPEGIPATFEFRHESWFDEDVFEALRERNLALCLAATDDHEPGIVRTADWGYLRLRRSGYSDPALKQWVDVARGQEWRNAFVFFKHEDEGAGPRMAERFQDLTASAV